MDFEYCDIMIIKGKQDNTKPKIKFVLREPTSNTSNNEPSQSCSNAIMYLCTKIILKGHTPSTPDLEWHKDKPLVGSSRKP